jgi:hypothetical protein
MTMREQRDLERRVDGFLSICERLILRGLMFACFAFEVGRFVLYLAR